MARHPSPADPVPPQPPPDPLDAAHVIVPAMACVWCGRLVVLTASGWRHRQGQLAARLPLPRMTAQELRRVRSGRG